MRRAARIALSALALVAGCAGEPDEAVRRLPDGCGLPTPHPKANSDLVPEPFLLEGVQVSRTARRGGRVAIALNVPLSVDGAFAEYKRASERAGFEIVQVDNEGFEAEIYLRKGSDLAAVQIRTSQCPEDAVVVYLNLPPDR